MKKIEPSGRVLTHPQTSFSELLEESARLTVKFQAMPIGSGTDAINAFGMCQRLLLIQHQMIVQLAQLLAGPRV
jgi:hypothetical protein